MGHHHSTSKGKDLSYLRRNGKVRLKSSLLCPICNKTFSAKIFTYADFDFHIESHQIEETPTEEPLIIPDDITYPEIQERVAEAREKLNAIKVHWSTAHINITVNRAFLLENSIAQLLPLNSYELRSEFHIFFTGENSQDAGGLTKEWMTLLIKEIFNEKSKLFRLSTGKEQKYLPFPHNNDKEKYILTGIIIGKAILENIPLDCSLCRSVLKYLLGNNCGTREIKYQDIDLYNSLRFFKKNFIDGIFFETFSVVFQNEVYPLVEDGENIPVTDENKEMYHILRVEYETYGCMALALDSLKYGFNSVIPASLLCELNYEDLNFMLCGNPVINFKDWKENTEYSGEYNSKHKVIQWFWEVLFTLNQKLKRDFLYYVTGTFTVPIEGFSALKTTRGELAVFKIVSIEYFKGVLPRAHTCFNRLDLPLYPSKNIMKDAIENVLANHLYGFGID